jgi:pyruvate kinase
MARFNVVQFFSDGTYEQVRTNVEAAEAVTSAKHYTECVGAKLGTTVRVIITDDDDVIGFEWKRGKGVTFPTREQLAGAVR